MDSYALRAYAFIAGKAADDVAGWLCSNRVVTSEALEIYGSFRPGEGVGGVVIV